MASAAVAHPSRRATYRRVEDGRRSAACSATTSRTGHDALGADARLDRVGITATGTASRAGEAPTRLVHGPAVFRIDRTGVDPDAPESEYRYVVVWKLNRDPRRGRITDADLRRGIDGERGNYSINGFGLADETGLPFRFRTTKTCFFTYVNVPWRRLDRVRVGRRVEVRLRPLTPDPSGKPTLGRLFVVQSTLRRSNPKLRTHAARAALRRIGCS